MIRDYIVDLFAANMNGTTNAVVEWEANVEVKFYKFDWEICSIFLVAEA